MSEVRIGLALGGGGARGLAHLHVLEAFDDLGVRPAAIAGTSIGALYGACYAAGMSGAELRAHTVARLAKRADVLNRLLKCRVGRIADLFGAGSRNPMLLDAEALVAQFAPEALPQRFEDLRIPFAAVATDFFERRQLVIRSGQLIPAIAASAAIPGVFRPVAHDGRTLIDGAMTNPLPFDVLAGAADVTLACDVTGGPVMRGRAAPNVFEAMLGAVQIMQGTIVAARLAENPPDALITPDVDGITLLDFLKSGTALKTSAATRADARQAIEALLRRG